MNNNELSFKYFFDFSQNIYADTKDDILEPLIIEALKEMKNDKKTKTITPEGKKKFFKIQTSLFYIAKENNAKMTVKYEDLSSRISVKLEADVIDFHTEKLKKLFVDTITLSKFISVESRTNNKFAIIVEIDMFEN